MSKSKNRSRRKLIILGLILVTLVGLGAVALLRKREPVITVQGEKVTRRSLTEKVLANGRIQPVWQVKISPEVSGEIIELPVKEGQRVEKGQLLMRIKPDFYVASRNSMEASYKGSLASRNTAEANLRKAETEHERVRQLFETKLVSESQYLDVKTAYEIAQAQLLGATHQVAMAKAALEKAEEDLRKTTINSPLSGTVSRLNSQLGERVVGTAMMAGTDVMTIADLNEMEARVDIGEIDVVLIDIGQKAQLEVDAFKNRKFSGLVTEIANSSKGAGMQGMGGGQSQEATKFEVKIRVNEKETFRPGMSVNAEIETRSRTNALTVPIASVTTRLPKGPENPKNSAKKGASNPKGTNTVSKTNSSSGTNTAAVSGTNASSSGPTNETKSAKKAGEQRKPVEVVFVIEGDRVKMVPVKIGISNDEFWEITEGLKEGQEVVSGGYKAISRELEDGKRIRKGPAKGEEKAEKLDT